MDAKVRHFSPAETAVRLGVSVKALRVYERHGLVRPLRTGAGWRAYGPDQIARLHQVMALRGLGLPLSKIAALLADRTVDLERVLALQEAALSERRARVDEALRLIRAARAKLKTGEGLSIDDLTTLAKETAMSEPETMTERQWKDIFHPLAEKHFSPDELKTLQDRDLAFDQAESTAAWNGLIAECKLLMQKDDPTSPQAQDLAARWMAEVEKFTQGDPALFARSAALWKDAMADPETAPALPLTPEMFAFVGKAEAARKAGRS